MHIGPQMILPSPSEEDETAVVSRMPPLGHTHVEAVGRWFEAYCTRRHQKQTISYHSLNSSSSEASEGELSDDGEDDEGLLRSLDPKDWKNQDHYHVLGLAKLRYKATADQIKRAYKKKVLRHHPDKRKARGLSVKDGDDDYFTCITRAIEVLGIPVKRRSYDSVDPEFDDTIPSVNQQESKDNFYEVFGPVFKGNARWSNKKKVPDLGDDNSSFDAVNSFYAFWYDFNSWREYSYLDEEEKEKGENRDERRWIDKQNRAAQQKRKKEEVARIRQLTDNACACDPRIPRFKEEEKARKLAQKQAKQDALRQKQEEEERKRKEIADVERKKREQEEEEQRVQAAAVKKEKDAQKKAFKKERKTMRTKLKEYDYFATDESERVLHMQEVEKLAEILSLTSLQSLNEDLGSDDCAKAKQTFLEKMKEVNDEIEAEKQRQMEASKKSSSSEGGGSAKSVWPDAEVQLLIKAVNLFPAGTVQRWETVGNFIHQHMETSNRHPKEVLAKAKELQKMDMSTIKEATNKRAFENYAKTHHASAAPEQAEASQRFDTVADQQIGETGSNPAPWTAEEQKLLEQALRTFPASTADRWDRIAETIATRSRKDCMKRYKELVDMVRAKKAAQTATKKK